MREWLAVAAIAAGFGILASFASEEPGWFALANFGLAAASLVLGAIQVAFRARHASAPAFRRPVALGLLRVALALVAAVALERGVAWLGVQLAPDPGSATAAHKTLAGVSADDLRAGELTSIQNKNGTWYTTKHGIAITFEGKAPGGRFIDSTRFIDWLIETIQVDIYALLVNNPKLPYDNSGIQTVKSTVEIALHKGQRVGGIALSPEPLVTVPDVLDTDVADRALRILRDVKFNCRLAGALHRVVVSGTVSV